MANYLDDLKGKSISVGGVPLPDRKNLSFTGAGVTGSDDSANNATVIDVSGGGGGEVFVEIRTSRTRRRARGNEDDDARGDGLSDAQGDVARGGNRARGVHGGARGPFGQVRATTKGVSERAGRARARFDHRLYL